MTHIYVLRFRTRIKKRDAQIGEKNWGRQQFHNRHVPYRLSEITIVTVPSCFK